MRSYKTMFELLFVHTLKRSASYSYRARNVILFKAITMYQNVKTEESG